MPIHDHITLNVNIPEGLLESLVRIETGQAQIKALLLALTTKVNKMSDTLPDAIAALTAEVERNTSVDQSAATAINGLIEQVEALKAQITDPAAIAVIDNFTAQLRTSSDALVAAIPANT